MLPRLHSRRVRFGVFELDLETGDLSKAGRLIKLQNQPRQVLRTLVSRRGELVTREELRRELWPDETFVDFDNGLNVAIRKIREALGDVAPSPMFIATERARGYRFIAPVAEDKGVREAALVPPYKVAWIAAAAVAGILVWNHEHFLPNGAAYVRFASRDNRSEWNACARTAAGRALQLDPQVSEAHLALAARVATEQGLFTTPRTDWNGLCATRRSRQRPSQPPR